MFLFVNVVFIGNNRKSPFDKLRAQRSILLNLRAIRFSHKTPVARRKSPVACPKTRLASPIPRLASPYNASPIPPQISLPPFPQKSLLLHIIPFQ